MARDFHNQCVWQFGDPLTPKILETALERFKIAKANHTAQWEDITGAPPSSTGQATTPSSSRHALQDDYMPGFLTLPSELKLSIWEEATLQYFGKLKRILYKVPENDQWSRKGHLLTSCPIKNVCMESRNAYNKVLKAFPPVPVYCFVVPLKNTQDTFEQWAPTDGSISELFLRGQNWRFFSLIGIWNEGRLRRVQTIYIDPEGFLKTNPTLLKPWPTKSLPMNSEYYQAQRSGTYLIFQKTQISPSATDLYEDLLFSTIDDRDPARSVPPNRMWIRCAQMQRKLNGDLMVIYSVDMPWAIGELELQFLFMRLGPCFRRLSHLKRIAFVKPVNTLPESCQSRCCCIMLGSY